MKILFLLAPGVSTFEEKQTLEISIGGTNAAGVIESYGHEVHLYDLNYLLNQFRGTELLTDDEFRSVTNPNQIINISKNLKKLPNKIDFWTKCLAEDIPNVNDYDAVCVSLNRWMYKYYPAIASYAMSVYLLKELNVQIPIFMGGEYAYEMMEAYDCFDNFVNEIDFISYVRGRDISSFIDSLNSIVPKRVLNLGQVKKAQIDFKADCNHEFNNPIQNIFSKDILSKYPKLKDAKSVFLSPFKFSEGCVFKCAFCTSGIDPFFVKSEVMETVDKLERSYDKGFTDFRFYNDNVNFKLKYTVELANEIIRRNLKIRFSDSANLRIGSKEMYDALGESGCIKLWYGTEHVSPRILKDVHKEVPIERINQMLRWSDEAGIWNCCNFIFNFPHETDEEFEMLIDFIESNIHTPQMNVYKGNVFKMTLGTEYEMYPEKFDIELIGLDSVSKMQMFNEINGVKWKQRVVNGKNRRKRINRILDQNERLIRENDHILFACRKAGYNKKETQNIIKDITSGVTEEYMSSIRPGITMSTHYENIFATYQNSSVQS